MSKLWDVSHAYYCTEGNYFRSRDSETKTVWEFKSWADFIGEMGDSDMDYNLLFRWDWKEEDEAGKPTYTGDDYYRNGRLLLFFMHQRKGYHSTSIIEVCRADESAVIEFLRPRLEYLLRLWLPLASPSSDAVHEEEPHP